MNRYKHLRETDPAEAEQLRQRMAEHLRKIDGQLTAALGMLDHVPVYKKKVEMQIRMFHSHSCCSVNFVFLLLELKRENNCFRITSSFISYCKIDFTIGDFLNESCKKCPTAQTAVF